MTRYDYRISSDNLRSLSSGTGTLSVTSGTINVTGSGTAFSTQLAAGDIVVSGGYTLCVLSVTDNTHLLLQNASPANLSGDSFQYDKLTNVESMTTGICSAPRSVHRPWEEVKDTGDGLARGFGRPACTWNFGFITQRQRDVFRTYCTGKSARVYIRTRQIDNADSMRTYTAAMMWPDQEDRQSTRRLNFTLEFRDLVLV